MQDGKTRGFWLLVQSRPCPIAGGRSPSIKTIAAEGSSRDGDLGHRRALGELRELIEDRPVVLDREFSYEDLSAFADLKEEGIGFVCRLDTGNHPFFFFSFMYDEEGKRVILSLKPGERISRRGLYYNYKGKIKAGAAGEWVEGLREPLWVITDLGPEEALRSADLSGADEDRLDDQGPEEPIESEEGDEQGAGTNGEGGGVGAVSLRHRIVGRGSAPGSDVWGRERGKGREQLSFPLPFWSAGEEGKEVEALLWAIHPAETEAEVRAGGSGLPRCWSSSEGWSGAMSDLMPEGQRNDGLTTTKHYGIIKLGMIELVELIKCY